MVAAINSTNTTPTTSTTEQVQPKAPLTGAQTGVAPPGGVPPSVFDTRQFVRQGVGAAALAIQAGFQIGEAAALIPGGNGFTNTVASLSVQIETLQKGNLALQEEIEKLEKVLQDPLAPTPSPDEFSGKAKTAVTEYKAAVTALNDAPENAGNREELEQNVAITKAALENTIAEKRAQLEKSTKTLTETQNLLLAQTVSGDLEDSLKRFGLGGDRLNGDQIDRFLEEQGKNARLAREGEKASFDRIRAERDGNEKARLEAEEAALRAGDRVALAALAEQERRRRQLEEAISRGARAIAALKGASGNSATVSAEELLAIVRSGEAFPETVARREGDSGNGNQFGAGEDGEGIEDIKEVAGAGRDQRVAQGSPLGEDSVRTTASASTIINANGNADGNTVAAAQEASRDHRLDDGVNPFDDGVNPLGEDIDYFGHGTDPLAIDGDAAIQRGLSALSDERLAELGEKILDKLGDIQGALVASSVSRGLPFFLAGSDSTGFADFLASRGSGLGDEDSNGKHGRLRFVV